MGKITSFRKYVQGEGDAASRYNLETFAFDFPQVEPYVNTTASNQFQKLRTEISNALVKRDPSIHMDKIAQLANYINAGEGVKKTILPEQLQDPGISLTRKPMNPRHAGFINASILLYAIMNIAIIIAITVFLL